MNRRNWQGHVNVSKMIGDWHLISPLKYFEKFNRGKLAYNIKSPPIIFVTSKTKPVTFSHH